jgi:hypothetical protein
MTWFEEAVKQNELRVKKRSNQKARSGAIHAGIKKERKRILNLLKEAGYPESTIRLIEGEKK